MEEITCTICANNDGRYSTNEVLKQIRALCNNIVFPDKDISETCMLDLSLNGEKCYYGITEGIWETWNPDKLEYMKRKLTLYFA